MPRTAPSRIVMRHGPVSQTDRSRAQGRAFEMIFSTNAQLSRRNGGEMPPGHDAESKTGEKAALPLVFVRAHRDDTDGASFGGLVSDCCEQPAADRIPRRSVGNRKVVDQRGGTAGRVHGRRRDHRHARESVEAVLCLVDNRDHVALGQLPFEISSLRLGAALRLTKDSGSNFSRSARSRSESSTILRTSSLVAGRTCSRI